MLFKRVRAVTAQEMPPWELCADKNSQKGLFVSVSLASLFSCTHSSGSEIFGDLGSTFEAVLLQAGFGVARLAQQCPSVSS